jgi:N4-gp56 family major capsid protein
MFIKRFMGTGENSMIQRITELTKTEKGEQVLMHLVADLVEDGVIGDNEREGNEEAMQSYSQVINIDLMTHSVRNKGKLAEQKTVINFREMGRDRLAYWLANRIDQLAFLTMSGIATRYNNNGAARVGSPFPNLSFAPTWRRRRQARADVERHGAGGLQHRSIASTYVPSYKMIVDAVAYAKTHYVKPLMADGKEYYVMLVQPGTLAALKKDADYQRAGHRGDEAGRPSPWFTGATVTVDGAVLHEHRLVYNTKGAATARSGALPARQRHAHAAVRRAGAGHGRHRHAGVGREGVPVRQPAGHQRRQDVRPAEAEVLLDLRQARVEDFGVVSIDHYEQ